MSVDLKRIMSIISCVQNGDAETIQAAFHRELQVPNVTRILHRLPPKQINDAKTFP